MESQGGTQLKVGIFLSLGIAVILVSIFMLGADRALFKSYMHLHAHFDQVQGLSDGSVVSLSGITVGNIEKISYDAANNIVDVTMKVDESYARMVTKTSQVEIRTQGALGDKFIFIIPGDAKSEKVQNGDVLSVAPPTDLFGVIAQRGNETNKIFDTINEVYKMTKQINADNRLEKIMSNMAEASVNMNQASSEAKKMMAAFNAQKIQSSIDRMDSIMTKIDNGQGTLGALINDPSIHNKLKSFLGASDRKNNLKYLMRSSIEKDGD